MESTKTLTIPEQKNLLQKIGTVFGILQMLSMGVINAVYSDTRWPTTRGTQLLLDFIKLGPSNPYAILSGVFVFAFFYRWVNKLEEIRDGKIDLIWILILISLIVFDLALMKGILVYR
jgi:type II secretory pathway component PulF